MGLEITRKKDGTLRSKWWYGRFELNGKTKCVNLDVEIKGKVPKTLKEIGNPLFERSRAQAQVKLDGLVREARSRKAAEKHLEDLYELKSGAELRYAQLTELEMLWDQQPTKKARSPQWIKNQHSSLKAFREHIEKLYPNVQTLAQVTPTMAREWMRTYEEKNLCAETYNHKLVLLRSLFVQGNDTGVLHNPFGGIPTKKKQTIHRQPFTPDELTEILKHCCEITRPVFITGMCTAMRRGDCCMLKWESVDLKNGFITINTSKTGEIAEIPLFPILRDEIQQRHRQDQYIFPEAAAMYQKNASMISHRFKKVLKAAGIQTRIKREGSERKVSVKDFHSLRTTWITMALSAGVPMELVRRVTGHSTVEVVLKHYFRPGRDVLREALGSALPQIITGSPQALLRPTTATPKDALLFLAEKAEQIDRDTLVAELKKLVKQLAA